MKKTGQIVLIKFPQTDFKGVKLPLLLITISKF
ncbi:Uncharacterised protein [uncultured archaeon]|nr:Uncharacterised protein [uncultured archaeon]